MMRMRVGGVVGMRYRRYRAVASVPMSCVTEVTVVAAMTVRTLSGVTVTSQPAHSHRAEANGPEREADYIRIHNIRPVRRRAPSRRP